MASYTGKHAQLYDIFYASKDYSSEADFIQKMLTKYSKIPVLNVLELAGGTGKHASLLSNNGYKLMVTDSSPDMIDAAKKKHQQNQALAFEVWDMSSPRTFTNQFDAVICLFDSIGYVQTNEKIASTLKNVHNNIKEGGIFIMEFWNAGAMIKSYEPYREKYFQQKDQKITRISETSLNYPQQTATVDYTIIITENDQTEYIKESQTNRYFLIQEMANFLATANLIPIKFFAGFEEKENISTDVWHTVVVAQKETH